VAARRRSTDGAGIRRAGNLELPPVAGRPRVGRTDPQTGRLDTSVADDRANTRGTAVAVSVDLTKGLDKAYENASLDEILAAPPSALAGVTERHDAVLKELFGIDTVAELGSNKYFALAGVLVALKGKTA
jgi:hypothetical protein